jgi:chromate transporter
MDRGTSLCAWTTIGLLQWNNTHHRPIQASRALQLGLDRSSGESLMIDPNKSDLPARAQISTPAIRASENNESAVAGSPARLNIIALGTIFLKIGATSFGGLGPSLAVIERELVDKRRVLTAQDVAEAFAASRLLPGSTLVQVVSFLGYRLGGGTGSGLATLACVLPSAIAMLLLAVFYDSIFSPAAVRPIAQGLTAAVVGLLLATMYRFGHGTVGDVVSAGIALAAFVSSAVFGAPAAAVVLAAGLIGFALLSSVPPGRASGKGKEG